MNGENVVNSAIFTASIRINGWAYTKVSDNFWGFITNFPSDEETKLWLFLMNGLVGEYVEDHVPK